MDTSIISQSLYNISPLYNPPIYLRKTNSFAIEKMAFVMGINCRPKKKQNKKTLVLPILVVFIKSKKTLLLSKSRTALNSECFLSIYKDIL